MDILHFKYLDMSNHEQDEGLERIAADVKRAGRRYALRYSLLTGAAVGGLSFVAGTGLIIWQDTVISSIDQQPVAHEYKSAAELGAIGGTVLGAGGVIYELIDYHRTFETEPDPKNREH